MARGTTLQASPPAAGQILAARPPAERSRARKPDGTGWEGNTDGSRRFNEVASDLLVELALFLSSYAPLFVMLAVRFEDLWLTITCAALAAIGLLSALVLLRRFRGLTGQRWPIQAVEDRGSEVAGYLASYLLPFLTVAEPSWRDLTAYGLFLALTAVVYIRSGLLQVNPTLYVFGWRLSAVDINGWNGYVLSRRRLRAGEQLVGVRLTDRIFVA